MRDSIPPFQAAHLAECDCKLSAPPTINMTKWLSNVACHKTIRGTRYKVRKHTSRCSQSNTPQCMHPNCPDFDLCSDCEALPIPVHPLNHPMLKLRTCDTVIPTVYRVGQTRSIDEPVSQKSAVACGESRSPILFPANLLASATKSPEPKPVIISGQVTNLTLEDHMPSFEEFLSPLGSPASEVPGAAPTSVSTAPPHLLVDVSDPPVSPRSVHPAQDIYHQLWPRVNQEMIHLNAVEAPKAEDGVPAVEPVGDAITITAPVAVEPLVAEEVPAGSPTTSSLHQAAERHETCPVSPVPSTKSIVDGYCTPSCTLSNPQEPHGITQSPASDQQEIVVTKAPLQRLDSVLVGDTNVPDGQIFPPGAEFVKGWHMKNNGALPWPPTTEVLFVAGEVFAPERSTALRAKVGVVHPGQDLDIWTGDLKVCTYFHCNGWQVPDFG